MSTRAVIISLIVAIALGAGALYLIGRPGSKAPSDVVPIGANVLQIVPSTVRSITVSRPDGGTDEVRVAGTPGEWELVMHGPGRSAAGTVWSLGTARGNSIVRVLAEMRAVAEPDPQAALGDDATTVEISTDDGTKHTLRLAGRTLGGQGLVAVDGPGAGPTHRRAIVDDGIHNVFRNPGPRGWRETAVFPGLDVNVSRFRLENGKDQRIALSRLSNHWRVTEPVVAPADPKALESLVAALGSLTIVDFLDGKTPDPASTGLEKPTASILIERDRGPAANSAAGATQTDRREVTLGALSDSTGQRLYAAIGVAGARRVVTVDASGVAKLTLKASAFISPHATEVVAADIGSIVLERYDAPKRAGAAPPPPASAADATAGQRFKLTLDKWVEMQPDGKESMLAEADVKAVKELIAFLTGFTAPTISTDKPEGYTGVGRISLLSLGDAPLDTLEYGTTADRRFALRSDAGGSASVYRIYPMERAPALLGPALGQPGELGKPKAGDGKAAAGVDVIK